MANSDAPIHQAGTDVPAWCSAHKAPRSVVSATTKTAPRPPKPGRIFQKTQTAISLGLALALASGPVFATNTAMLQLLSALHKKGTIDDETYQAILLSAQADETQSTAASAEVAKKVDQSLVKLGTPVLTPGKFEIKDKPGDFAWRTIGRVQYDNAFFDNNGNFKASDNNQFRRVRMGVMGTVATNWKFKVEYDLREVDTGIAGLKDAYIEYIGKLPGIDPIKHPVDIKIGQSYEPFSFELLNGSNNALFTERALPANALSSFLGERNPGLKVTTWGESWTAAAGLFGTRQQETLTAVNCTLPTGTNFKAGAKFTCSGGAEETPPRAFNDGYAGTVRGTYVPWQKPGHVLHLGSAFSYRDFANNNPIQLRERMEVNETSIRLIDTGSFKADDFFRWNAEMAVIQGPFTFQGEYLLLKTHAPTKNDPMFTGYYVSAGWFFTGESRPYKFQEGTFDSVKPNSIVGKGGIGAWEVVTRYSSADLNDELINGGQENNWTVGVNWYPAPNIRFMADYVKVLEVKGGQDNQDRKFANSTPSAFVLRSAVFW